LEAYFPARKAVRGVGKEGALGKGITVKRKTPPGQKKKDYSDLTRRGPHK